MGRQRGMRESWESTNGRSSRSSRSRSATNLNDLNSLNEVDSAYQHELDQLNTPEPDSAASGQ